MPEPKCAAVEEGAPDAVETVRLTGVNGGREVVLREIIERMLELAGRKAGLGAGDVEADHAVIAVAHREFCDLEPAVCVAHRAHELADPDAATGVSHLLHALVDALLHGLDHLVEAQAATQVLLWSPAHLAVDHAVRAEVLHELPRNANQPIAGLHDADGEVEGLEVFDERTGIGFLGEPVSERV